MANFQQTAPDASEPLDANISRVPQGLIDVTLRPFPWESTSGIALLLARVENVVWYLLYALAALGAVVAVRRPTARNALLFPAFVTGLLVAVAAVTQGNLGTAFRHRNQILWALALGGAYGVQWLVTESRFVRDRTTAADPSAAIGASECAEEPLGVG